MAPKTDEPPVAQKAITKLPASASSPADIGRLISALEQIDESLLQLSLRHGGKDVKLPKTTKLMDQTIELNHVNLLQQADRQALQKFLVEVKARAPVLHISFSAEPTPAFLEKLLGWLRREIHPLVLVTVGLQPTLGVGCVVRSTNKYFDFSLRQDFAEKQELLHQLLVAKEAPAATVAAKTPEEVQV